MCGICGLVSLDGAGVDGELLDGMNRTLLHRGPDSGGSVVDGRAGLAARRLAIIDLDNGDQPISNEDGTVHVVQNGEIYNYRELREDLRRRGHEFKTRSDTEVLVHLYEERGPRFAEELRGMFAVAIWDAPRARLVLARDRYGIKPLYYGVSADRLAFGSELKALLADPAFPREVDPDGLEAFLAYACIPAPLTIFRGARKLPAGCVLTWQPGTRVQVERFARPTAPSADQMRSQDERELAAEIIERLRDSVRAHLIADVPVGVLLSGGIDSSVLTALAAEESARPVHTFSIGFEERGFDERARARLVAQRYGTDHHELVLHPDAAELLPLLAGVFDEPFADSSAIPTYLVSRLARQHVKVALSGEGGDELFGGYFNYVGHRLAPRIGRVAAPLQPLVERLPSSTTRASSLDYKAKRFVRGAALGAVERHSVWKSILSADQRAELLDPSRRAGADPVDLLRRSYEASAGAEELARIMDLDLTTFLVEDMLVKTDRSSMANSLEVRVPFLDPAVTDLALAIPSRLKVRGLAKKAILRTAVASLLPPEIVRGRKQGFSIPVGAWLRNDLQPFMRDVLSPDTVRRQGFFDPPAVQRLIDAHVGGQRDMSRQLWSLLAFSLWHERFAAPPGV